MNILLVGSGGREHAIALKLKESACIEKLFIAPGNGGTDLIGQNVPIPADEIEKLTDFAFKNSIDLIIAGPEVPLCMGFADLVYKKNQECGTNIAFFGPQKACALLESSKIFAKEIMTELNIPTAKYFKFGDFNSAKEFIEKNGFNFVIKADGLAAGKGVILPKSKEEALTELENIMIKKCFGNAGTSVIIEEKLEGEEVSVLAFSDGNEIAVMPPSQDHKRLRDNDEGPNTGGMGAYAPTPICSKDKAEEYARAVILPVIQKMKKNGTPYIGVLYAGLMLTKDGPKVLEYNCRFGDPETQVLMQLFDGDLVKTMYACTKGSLKEAMPSWKKGCAATVVMAGKCYPFSSSPKIELKKEQLENSGKVKIIHAGTTAEGSKIFASGGRVLCVTADGNNLRDALNSIYEKIKTIDFENCQYRTDIGKRGLEHLKNN